MAKKWVFEVPMSRSTEVAMTLGQFLGAVFPGGTARRCFWETGNRFVATRVAAALVTIDVCFSVEVKDE